MISFVLSEVAEAHLCAHRYNKALQCAQEGLAIAVKWQLSKETMDNMMPLAQAYEGLGDERNALRCGCSRPHLRAG